MTDSCQRLHDLVLELPEVRWPFKLEALPRNGIYFFTEDGEPWGHGGERPRIVRIGTHREGNFRSRMADHFVPNERKMIFTTSQAAPKDRSIFRKNIGRALLNRDHDPYIVTWEIDFTARAARDAHASKRDIDKERAVEEEISRVLRTSFAFRWIELEGEARRLGGGGLEAALIGTVASCGACRPTPNWLGRSSPKPKISVSGLWLEHHLSHAGMSVDVVHGLMPLFRGGKVQ